MANWWSPDPGEWFKPNDEDLMKQAEAQAKVTAQASWVLLKSYLEAGFTAEQAFELVKEYSIASWRHHK